MSSIEQSSTNQDVSPAAGLGLLGASAASLKARHDLGKIERGSLDWLRNVQKVPGDGSLLEKTQRAARAYASGGKDLATARVAGLRLPYFGFRAAPVVEAAMGRDVGKLKDYGKWLFGQGDMPDFHRHAHYKKFLKDTPENLTNYILTHTADEKISPDSLKLITKAPGEAEAGLQALKLVNPAEHALVNAHLENKLRYLAGLGSHGGGAAQTYVNLGVGPLRSAQRLFGAGGAALGIAGTAALAHTAFSGQRKPLNFFGKQATAQDKDSFGLGDAASMGAGGAIAGRGLQNLMRPMDVATTWSEYIQSHGAGHMMPGKAVRNTLLGLQNDPSMPKFNLHDSKLNAHGVVEPNAFGRKLDMLVDTGMGWTVPQNQRGYTDPNGMFNTIKMRGDAKPNVRLGGYVGYMTDLGSLGAPNYGAGQLIHSPLRSLAQKLGLKDSYIGFGPSDIFNSALQHEGRGRYRGHNVAPGGFPMLSNPAVQALSSAHANKDSIFSEALKSDVLNPQQKEMLRNIGDKKVLTVLGSGRGDYTALRTQELAEAIKARGLQDKVQLITMLGELGSKNPLSKNLEKYPNLLALQGKIPQNLYVGLPAASHMIDASTGTSSLFESLASPAKVVMRDSWNPIKQRELTALDNPDLWKNWTRSTHGGLTQQLRPVDLDAWNHGNRNVAANLPGVSRVHSADDILDSLMSSHGAEDAAQRGRSVLQASEAGAENLRTTLGSLLKRQNMLKNMRGVGQLALGSGLAAMPWWRKNDSPLRFN